MQALSAQHVQTEQCLEKSFHIATPAPCELVGNGVPHRAWWIQLAVYKNPPIPPPGVQVVKFGEYYFYYVNQNYTQDQAKEMALALRQQGYCGAFAVR